MQKKTRGTLIDIVDSYCLQPELYRQAAQAYSRAGYGMGEPLHETEPDEIHTSANEKDDPNHGCNCCRSEYGCYNYYAGPAARGGGIHQHGNQNFTRPENKNHKQHPGCNAHPAVAIVNVGVLLIVTVFVSM